MPVETDWSRRAPGGHSCCRPLACLNQAICRQVFIGQLNRVARDPKLVGKCSRRRQHYAWSKAPITDTGTYGDYDLDVKRSPRTAIENDLKTGTLADHLGLSIFPQIRHAGFGGMNTLYSGGNVTLYISDMDRSVRFYTDQLGMKLAYRFGNHWASIHAARGLTIGLHPGSPEASAAKSSSMSIGLELEGDIESAVSRLAAKGVQFDGPVRREKSGAFAFFRDPDGNPLYLTQLNWEHVNQGEGEYTHA